MNELLIVGAGPTGLTAAVELARRGIIPRVIDKKSKASTLSRAVGINSRTLTLLKKSGCTNALIKRGVEIRKGLFHVGNELAFTLDLSQAAGDFDFLLALPQDETEEVLSAAFESMGGNVEYGIELEELKPATEGVSVKLKNVKNESVVRSEFRCLYGADGIHSAVRNGAGIQYTGIELPDKWSIVDFESESWQYPENLCLFVFDKGRVALVVPIGKSRYRGVTDRPDARSGMPAGLKIDRVRREGEFLIWVKQAESYQNGSVFIGGDAAHSHSPVGGRGMNLGIADACAFARLYSSGNLNDYSRERHPLGRATITVTERARRLVTSEIPGKFFVMRHIIPALLRSSRIHSRVVNAALDTPESG